MYSYNDFQRLFVRYKLEGVPFGVSIEQFCLSNQIPYNLFAKWYKDIRKEIKNSGSGHPAFLEYRTSNSGGHPHEQWCSYQSEKFKQRRFEKPDRETGGPMLNITGLSRFFFVRDFHDMRCKYAKVLSIIHQQLNREPEDGDVFSWCPKIYV